MTKATRRTRRERGHMTVVTRAETISRIRWNGVEGRAWVDYQHHYDTMLAPLGRVVLDAAGIRPGGRVLDVGCGCGATTLEAAERAGATGSIVGVDLSALMLRRARERAGERGVINVEFVFADAQVHRFGLVDTHVVVIEEPVWVGDDPDHAAAFFEGANGHKIAAIAGDDVVPAIVAALREQLAQYATASGVFLPASAWLVTARGQR